MKNFFLTLGFFSTLASSSLAMEARQHITSYEIDSKTLNSHGNKIYQRFFSENSFYADYFNFRSPIEKAVFLALIEHHINRHLNGVFPMDFFIFLNDHDARRHAVKNMLSAIGKHPGYNSAADFLKAKYFVVYRASEHDVITKILPERACRKKYKICNDARKLYENEPMLSIKNSFYLYLLNLSDNLTKVCIEHGNNLQIVYQENLGKVQKLNMLANIIENKISQLSPRPNFKNNLRYEDTKDHLGDYENAIIIEPYFMTVDNFYIKISEREYYTLAVEIDSLLRKINEALTDVQRYITENNMLDAMCDELIAKNQYLDALIAQQSFNDK